MLLCFLIVLVVGGCDLLFLIVGLVVVTKEEHLVITATLVQEIWADELLESHSEPYKQLETKIQLNVRKLYITITTLPPPSPPPSSLPP